MSNPVAPRAEIALDKTRAMVFDYLTLALVEEQFPGTTTLGREFWQTLNAKKALCVAAAALVSGDADMKAKALTELMAGQKSTTLATAAFWLCGHSPAYIEDAVMRAYGMSTVEESAADPTQAPTPLQ